MCYSYSKNVYLCKICTVFYGDNPEPPHGSKGTWSHKGILFKDNPGKKLRRHERSDDHKDAIRAKTYMRIEESISAFRTEDHSNANELYITKLIQIVQFLDRNNLPVKFMFPKFTNFLADEMQEPIIKQYLDSCKKNATYTSSDSCDSFLQAIDKFYSDDANARIKKNKDFTIYADESASAARKEMLGIFIGTYAEEENDVVIDYLSLAQLSSTKSEIVVQVLEKTLLEKGIDLSNTLVGCLDGTNSMSG